VESRTVAGRYSLAHRSAQAKISLKKSPTSVYDDDDDIKIRCKATSEEQTTPAARVPKPYSKTEKLRRCLQEQAYYLVIRTKTISYLNAALQAR
jgi:hypothetical protein